MKYIIEDKFVGLVFGAVTAWALSTCLLLITVVFDGGSLFLAGLFLMYCIIFGLPAALLLTIPIGLIFWFLAELLHQVSSASSIIFGILTGTLVGISAFFIGINIVTSFLILPIIGGFSGYVSLRTATNRA